MNSVNLTGRLTNAPDQPILLASGKHVLDLRLAVNRPNGNTAFVKVKCWGRTAQNAATYLTKGSLVAVSGELAHDEWTDRATGELRQRHYINAHRVDFLDRRLGQAAPDASIPDVQPPGLEPF